MKVLTILGTRPEIIRLSRVIELFDKLSEHTLVHTGQNYDPALGEIFFEEMGVRKPDVYMGVRADSFAGQAAQIIEKSGEIMQRVKPDRVLILGDTNSGLGAIVASRLGIPVFHMEAGNRCYDDRVPEELNRRIIDHASRVLMPYTFRSMENLLREGIARDRIYVTGNPIFEVLEVYKSKIDASDVHKRLGISANQYTLVTAHRAENVDEKDRLESLLQGLTAVSVKYNIPAIVSLHPRTADRINQFGLTYDKEKIRLVKPLGFFDFVKLEKQARVVISDSGTVQEECAIFKVPNVTIRDVTERAETVEAGSNILASVDPELLTQAVNVVLSTSTAWDAPPEYLVSDVSRTVAKIVLGYLPPRTSLRNYR